jgi:Ricin-type beta-trefoil lectin domain
MRTIPRLFIIAAFVAGTAALGSTPALAGPATPAHQAKSSGGVSPAADPIETFQNQNTGRCIDDTDNGGFRTFACNGTRPQQWRVHVFNDGTRRLQNVNTGRCMFDSNGGFRTVTCDTSTNVSWFIDHPATGQIAFRNQNTGRCIDDTDNGGFRTFSCNGTRPQQWH